MNDGKAAVSAVVCTRNRGDRIVATIKSILANTHPNFELIIVDQSTNDLTETALKSFLRNPHICYIRSDTVGAGAARQIGLLQANSDIVAYTDDDCTVPPDWLVTLATIFKNEKSVGIVYGNVIAAPHDESQGTVPHHIYSSSRNIYSLWDYSKGIGMGANMTVRRNVGLALGGIDCSLGPGSRFLSGEDHDMAIRILINRWAVHETPATFVVHDGFRNFADFRKLTRRDWYAIGAVHAKYFKGKHWSIIPLILFNTLVRGIWHPLLLIWKGKRPQGFKRFIFYWEGFVAGMRSPVDYEKLIFQTSEMKSKQLMNPDIQETPII